MPRLKLVSGPLWYYVLIGLPALLIVEKVSTLRPHTLIYDALYGLLVATLVALLVAIPFQIIRSVKS